MYEHRPNPRRNSVGLATRERIILAAERLFAEQGIGGPSLEEIGAATGQRNKTAIQYYFGDRDGLVDAVIDYRSAATQDMRARMLAEMITDRREPDVRSLTEAIVHPVAAQLQPGNYYVRFLAQLTIARGPFEVAGAEFTTIGESLKRLLPHLPVELLEARFAIALDTNVMTLAHIQHQMAEGKLAVPLDVRVADLVELIAGGLGSPAPHVATRKRKTRLRS
jgi:AcrR family transcriptional regulator